MPFFEHVQTCRMIFDEDGDPSRFRSKFLIHRGYLEQKLGCTLSDFFFAMGVLFGTEGALEFLMEVFIASLFF